MSLPPRDLGYEDLYETPPPYRSPRLLAKITTACFVVYGAGIVAAYLLLWDARGIAAEMAGYRAESVAKLAVLESRAAQIDMINAGLTIACAIAFCFWTHRVATNARAFGAHTMTTPGMAVGSHFIPIYNLWKPYSALKEIWNGSDPEMTDDGIISYKGSRLMLAWWVSWLVAQVGSRALVRDDAESPAEWLSSYGWTGVSLALDAVALVLAILVVRALTRRQESRAVTVPPARIR